MKKLFITGLILIFSSSLIVAQNLDTEKFKFKMSVPEGFVFKTFESGKWGGIQGEEAESKTKVIAYAYTGEVSKEEIEQFGIKTSGIAEANWKETESGEGESGFEWHQMYHAQDKGKTLHGIIAKNETHDISYLFFVFAPDASFKTHEEDYLNWLSSVEGLE